MRIRSTKPEFWRSADTADLDFFARLLFVGLWNYVDDNGVGEDNLNLIRSDLFPRDPIEIVAPLIQKGLTELSLRAQIVRYEDVRNGRRYLKVVNWHHQKINRPTASKKPLPTSEHVILIDSSMSVHGGLIEDSLADQGNKGTREPGSEVAREQGNEGPPYPPDDFDEPPPPRPPNARKTGAEIALARAANIPARSAEAYRIAETFSASLPVPIEHGLLAGIGRQIDNCLKARIPPDAIAAGLREWTNSDSWSPSQIPSFVHTANNRGHNGHNGIGKPTEKALGYDAAAEQLIAALETTP